MLAAPSVAAPDHLSTLGKSGLKALRESSSIWPRISEIYPDWNASRSIAFFRGGIRLAPQRSDGHQNVRSAPYTKR
jgi:hypothetical protein